MKEKINLLSKGIFEYEKPQIVVSHDKITDQGSGAMPIEGFFSVKSSNFQEIRAFIFSSDKRVKVEGSIAGKNCNVRYSCDTRNTHEGQVITGCFYLISNGGDIEIPFEFKILGLYCNTSIGRINSLHQFADLAKISRNEALKIFCEPLFPNVFLKNKKYLRDYEMLILSPDSGRAMEEFLCLAKRKKPVRIKVSEDPVILNDAREKMGGKILLEKSDWGYENIYVSTEGNFLKTSRSVICTDDFLGSYYQLEFEADPSLISGDRGEGIITLRTNLDIYNIPVICSKEEKNRDLAEVRSEKMFLHQITDSYIRYRTGRYDRLKWLADTENSLSGLEILSPDNIRIKLFRIHFKVLKGELSDANEAIKELNGREIRMNSMEDYCYYLYLTAVLNSDESYTKYVLERVEAYYSRNPGDWKLLLMVLELNPHITSERKLMLLRNSFEGGACSPFIYLFAYEIYCDDPGLMKYPEELEAQIMNWALKNARINKDVFSRFGALISGSKTADPFLLNTLKAMYKRTGETELLSTICSLLIKTGSREEEDHNYYKDAVDRNIRLTGLYENFMYSVPETGREEIPREVLIYFTYDNRLPKNKRAVLYSFVLENTSKDSEIYNTYFEIIKAFTLEMLKEGYISKPMIILYRQFLSPENISETTAKFLPGIIFKNEVTCTNDNIKGIVVSHNDLEREDYYPLNNGIAYVDIFMDDHTIMPVDVKNNRFAGTVPIKVKAVFDDPDLLKRCMELYPDDMRLLLNRSEKALKYQKTDDVSIQIYKRVLELPHISSDYQKSILKNLVDYYYDNYEGMTLEKYLLQLNIDLFDSKERNDIIEYYIQKGIYNNAYDACLKYGYEGIDKKRLMRLCSRVIRDIEEKKDDDLLEMAYNVFSAGRFDETILRYLGRYYMGRTQDLYRIWKACKDFEIKEASLEERILCYILFTEDAQDKGQEIFDSYYKRKTDTRIVRAFLSFYSYKYLIKEEKVSQKLFDYIEMELPNMKECRDICGLALLKHYALTEKGKNMPDWVVKEAEGFAARGIILPFFERFEESFLLPKELTKGYFVEIKTDPGAEVSVSYIIEDDTSDLLQEKTFTTEDMKNVFNGIYLKKFTLFYGEEARYYTKITKDDYSVLSENDTLKGSGTGDDKASDAFERIDEMSDLYIQGDLISLQEREVEFEKLKNISNKLFKMHGQEQY